MTHDNHCFRPRVLLIAESANPEWVSVPLEGWSHARALARVADAHTVTQVRNAEAWRRAGVPAQEYTAIDSERSAGPLYRWGSILRGGAGRGWTTMTAFSALAYYGFERELWRRFGGAIRAGEFDLVHRITPLSPTIPSPIAARCAAAGVPFVMGPLNGGLPWPWRFDAARRREREWLSYLRGLYRLLPHARSMRRHASAIIAGSRATLEQMPAHARRRCVYIPENAVDPARFVAASGAGRGTPTTQGPLRVVFVGRLVPYKGADMLLEAAAPLLRGGAISLEIVGDGPERSPLAGLAGRLGIADRVRFAGWIEHARLAERIREAEVFAFPSIREFGGAVVAEAMALGVCPIVVDYGGPGEIVTDDTGFRLPMGPRATIIASLRAVLERLAATPGLARELGERARRRIEIAFTWDAKARQVLEVYRWVLGARADKPDFGLPIDEARVPAVSDPDAPAAIEPTRPDGERGTTSAAPSAASRA